jgi:hypothetical protein
MSGLKQEKADLLQQQKDLDRRFLLYSALAFVMCAGYFLVAAAQLDK